VETALIFTEKFLLPANTDDAQRQAIVRERIRKRRGVSGRIIAVFPGEDGWVEPSTLVSSSASAVHHCRDEPDGGTAGKISIRTAGHNGRSVKIIEGFHTLSWCSLSPTV
jgi:hypothetical protein